VDLCNLAGVGSVAVLGDFISLELGLLLKRDILSDSLEVGVDHGVRLLLPRFDDKALVKEASVDEHVPDSVRAPEIWLGLRDYLYRVVVVPALQGAGH